MLPIKRVALISVICSTAFKCSRSQEGVGGGGGHGALSHARGGGTPPKNSRAGRRRRAAEITAQVGFCRYRFSQPVT
jgi:hypothetical protein